MSHETVNAPGSQTFRGKRELPAAEVRVPWKDRGHRVMTGSSFAAAWLSGMLARLLSVYPEIDPILAKSLLRRVATEGK